MNVDFELKRNDYYKGKRIDVDDLKLEQRYFMDKIRAINSALVGYGIVDGLTVKGVKNKEKKIIVNKGIGIDSHGNFIMLMADKTLDLPTVLKEGDHIYLKYSEKSEDRTSAAYEDTCNEACVFDHIVEDVEVYISDKFMVPEVDDVECASSKLLRFKSNISEFLNLPVFKRLGFLKKMSQLSRDLPLLYIGQYVKSGKRSSINTRDRVYLHTNAEISKLLCTIYQSYVRTVNGQSGDLNLVASISGVSPNESGEIELAAGNNVVIDEEENKLTISMKSGYHNEFFVQLLAKGRKGSKREIEHGRSIFPSVDIYKRVEAGQGQSAVMYRDLLKEARALNMETKDFLAKIGAKTYKELYKPTVHEKSKTVHSMLKKAKITDMSHSVMKEHDAKINVHIDNIYVVPKYSYEKVVGKDDSINIKVTHVDRNTVRLENNSSTGGYYMVVLNA